MSKTRDAIFHNSFRRCLTYYIEMLNVVSLLIPPETREIREKRQERSEIGKRDKKEIDTLGE